MRYRCVAGTDLHARRAAVEQEAGDALLAPLLGGVLTAGRKDDDEVRDVGVADEMLRAVDYPIEAIAARGARHSSHVGTSARLRHRKRVDLLPGDARNQVALFLLAAARPEDL